MHIHRLEADHALEERPPPSMRRLASLIDSVESDAISILFIIETTASGSIARTRRATRPPSR